MARLADADVRKLKCIFFQNTRDIVEVEWYGLKCNLEEKLEILETAKIYLYIIQNCFEDYSVECAIKEFIKRHYNICKLTLTPCAERETVEENVS